MSRHETLTCLAEHLCAVAPDRPALVAIDGFDGAGKTVLAQELVALVLARGARPAINVSIDGFHHPRAQRYATGRGPESFYRASYDYEAFRRCVVTPLRTGHAIIPAAPDRCGARPQQHATHHRGAGAPAIATLLQVIAEHVTTANIDRYKPAILGNSAYIRGLQ